MNPTEPQNMSLDGLTVAELTVLKDQITTTITNIQAQIAAAPIVAKQQTLAHVAQLNTQVTQNQKNADAINLAIEALNNPAPVTTV